MKLIERSLAYLRCPKCHSDALGASGPDLECGGCSALYPIRKGIVDFYPEYRSAKLGAQLAMESRFIVSIYEKHWRPWFTSLGSTITYEEEEAWLLAQDDRDAVESVLDVGAGTGRYARILSDAYRPKLVIALDLSKPMIEKGKEVAEEEGYDNILFTKGDAQRLPVRDGAIDLLNCFGALHLFPDPYRAIDELARVARPGAVFTCLTAGKSNQPRTSRTQGWFSNLASFHFFDIDEMRAKLASVGFEDFNHTLSGSVLLFSARRTRAAG
jgi:ubiquinone/menaquinone biosynthesis C-methylase UbiE